MPEIVRLSKEEMQEAAEAADRLHTKIKRRGVGNAHGASRISRATEHAGAQAELAVAKYYDVEWTSGREDSGSKSADVGERTQVRSTTVTRPSHSLLVRPHDLEKYGNVPFVLVICEGRNFIIKGWAMAEEVKTKGRVYDGNGRPPVYMLSEKCLHSPDTLENP